MTKTVFTLNGIRGIAVEHNSDLPFSAMEADSSALRLLSPGNKYLPMTPPFRTGLIRAEVSADPGMSAVFLFGYDGFRRRGEAVRFASEETRLILESGFVRRNRFEPAECREFPPTGGDVDLEIRLAEHTAVFRIGGAEAEFPRENPAEGSFAFSRGHYYGVITLRKLTIETENPVPPFRTREFTVPFPTQPTQYPIFCRVKLEDYPGYSDASFEFSGGVRNTDPGEGNYHVMRTDILENLYFKAGSEKYILAPGRNQLVPEKQEPPYYYSAIFQKLPWPFRTEVRFPRTGDDLLLTVGAELYKCSIAPSLEQAPSETVFTSEGKVVFSGSPGRILFRSAPEKEIAKRLPFPDADAQAFVGNNHFFLEGEKIAFRIFEPAIRPVCASCEILVENAFFEPIARPLFSRTVLPEGGAVSETVLPELKPGVWHLRFRSLDGGLPPEEEYCAFEVMSRAPGAKPPPLLSGLPYLYNSRTETRGLETDGFDPFFGEGSDEGHYISCSNFLAARARRKHAAAFVHAYGREWFLWLGGRCVNAPALDSNRDLAAEADYVNFSEENRESSLLWLGTYAGKRRDFAEEFMHSTGDLRLKGAFSRDAFEILAREYWTAFLDHMNLRQAWTHAAMLERLRMLRPDARYSAYGPAHIYAAHYKGAEFIQYLGNADYPAAGHGFWQYEDYPYACRYGLERGVYFFASCRMSLPGHRIYPEIYTGSLQGCPDGAVLFAHPPHGFHGFDYPPVRIRRRFLEYVYSGVYFAGRDFHYWTEPGFQACGFSREHYRAMALAAKVLRDNPPLRPPRGATAFVWSEDSWRANQQKTLLRFSYGIEDVRKTSAEDVPYAYERFRAAGLSGGFLCSDSELKNLDPERIGLLVLPPVRGMKKEIAEQIRVLHAKGVNLICFEDAGILADLFGVRDTGKETVVTGFHSPDGKSEFCDEPLFGGRFEALPGTEVLLSGEIPVLTLRKGAAFFNVPPTLARQDELTERLGYGLECVSERMNSAVENLMKRLARPEVSANAGRIAAFETTGNRLCAVAVNPSEKEPLFLEVSLPGKDVSCDFPHSAIPRENGTITVRMTLPPEGVALLSARNGDAEGRG